MTIKLAQDGNINFIQTGTTTAANTIADLRITTNNTAGTTFITIVTSGNIGIGTTNPRESLEISPQTGNTCGLMLMAGDDSGVNRIIFNHSNTTAYQKVQLQSKALGSGQGARADFAICINTSNDANNATFSDHKLFVSGNTGNIGIGTTNPTYKLQVNGTSYFNNNTGHSFVFNKESNTAIQPIVLSQQRGDNSWGMISEFRTIDANTNRPSIGFSSYATGTTWSLGYIGNDDHFRISQNHGHRHGGWGTERLRINTDGTLHFNNNTYHYGKIIVQNVQDGGSSRGIHIWTDSDTNWGIYMATAGGGRSLSGGTSTSGVYGFTGHAIRFRVANNAGNGFIFENSSEEHLMSIRGDDGHVHIVGNVTIGRVSPEYRLDVDGGITARDWFRVVGGQGLFWQSYGRGIWSADSASASYGNVSAYGGGLNGWNGYDINGRYTFMASGDMVGIHDKNNSWALYATNSDVTIPKTLTVNNLNYQGYSTFYQTGSCNPASGGTINWVRMGRVVTLDILNVPTNQTGNEGNSVASNLPVGIRPIRHSDLIFSHMHAWNGDNQYHWWLETNGNISFHFQYATSAQPKNVNLTLTCTVTYMCAATTSQ